MSDCLSLSFATEIIPHGRMHGHTVPHEEIEVGLNQYVRWLRDHLRLVAIAGRKLNHLAASEE
jgi:hypothetical protein